MAIFLTQQQLYMLIQRELPEDVYPIAGDQSTYLSTADSGSTAQMIRKVYEHLETAYDNQWPQHANVEGIALHEIARFGKLSPSLALQERRDRVLGKMRALPSMSDPDLISLVEGLLPAGPFEPFASTRVLDAVDDNDLEQELVDLVVETYRWNYPGNTWRLGESLLGVDTILGGGMRAPAGVDVCEYTFAELGYSSNAQLLDARENAYSYDVNIYDGDVVVDVTSEMLATIEEELSAAEPARSRHHIYNSGLRTTLPTLELLESTSLHLIADNWNGGATWYDESGSGNHATRVGTPVKAASDQFYGRYSIARDAVSEGFYAPGDTINGSTERTYELVLDDYGVEAAEFIIGRVSDTTTQHSFFLYKNTNDTVLSAIWPSDGFGSGFDHIHMGGGYDEPFTVFALPVMFHVVIDVPNQTIQVWRNGVQMVQASDPLQGALGTLANPKLGILGKFNTATNTFDAGEGFSGKLLEVARHEEIFTPTMIAARVEQFNRLKGY